MYIPQKRDKWGRKFGFVKFKEVRDVEELEVRLGDVCFCGSKLKINLARFGREEVDPKRSDKELKNRVGPSTKVVSDLSYRNVLHWKASSEECFPAMEVQVKESVLLELENCYVGVLPFHRDIQALRTSFFMEGLFDFKVTVMGAGLVLIKCNKQGDMERARESNRCRWEANFKEVRRWLPELVAKRRNVWLQVYGIPLHIWDEDFFKLLGTKFGVFLDFDECTIEKKRLDVARILVDTPRLGVIDEMINISVVGERYKIWVMEEAMNMVEGRWKGEVDGGPASVEGRSGESRLSDWEGEASNAFSVSGDGDGSENFSRNQPRAGNLDRKSRYGDGTTGKDVGETFSCVQKKRSFLGANESAGPIEELHVDLVGNRIQKSKGSVGRKSSDNVEETVFNTCGLVVGGPVSNQLVNKDFRTGFVFLRPSF